ncbi:MAG TPA: OmpH family outer membrane protein [Saprospiraceae bacterium]|jgi:outer membrane protein|nr:MAG: outer membrane chaperone Skp [Candidatus Parvibacillus calidus]MBX2937236.1 OmpH family outer membrane protein [Saprospiraceae bacterium]MBK7740906.1 OmpH family outer membrane protein [Candidatus Parvibacillus calidus]MBX7179763.1 OmpH family outer membrane protein [Saprospiraceae bacterium]MCB0592236.1 OmpH family outer membrane protein [Saprospiraceae bacterium]
MIKNVLIAGLFALLSVGAASAQRVAVVDIAGLLENMPEYAAAQKQLDDLSATWRAEINAEMDKIKGLYNKYQAELPLLNDDMKRKREDEITNKEKEVRDLQRARFGTDGALFAKREELVKPIQDKVYKAIDDYAKERGFDLILDKSSAAGVLFVSDGIDKTADIAKRIK